MRWVAQAVVRPRKRNRHQRMHQKFCERAARLMPRTHFAKIAFFKGRVKGAGGERKRDLSSTLGLKRLHPRHHRHHLPHTCLLASRPRLHFSTTCLALFFIQFSFAALFQYASKQKGAVRIVRERDRLLQLPMTHKVIDLYI